MANAWLRPGNTADSSNCKSFLEETYNEVLKGKKVGLLQADSCFYTDEILRYLESISQNYIISVRMYPNVKNMVYGLEHWVEICKGIEVIQMIFGHQKSIKRRYIVVRKQIELRPKATGKLLFEDMPGYRYSCYVTNLDLPLDVIWDIYNSRTDCENRIKELKQDFGLDNFCLKDFWGTEASFRSIIVAYNIMSLFRYFAFQSHKKSTLKTLRLYCFALGTWRVNHSNRKTLKIALPVKRRQWMDGIFSQIQNLSQPFVFSNA